MQNTTFIPNVSDGFQPSSSKAQAAWQAYLQAKTDASADVAELQKLVLANGNGHTATLFAAEVPGADVAALQERVLEIGTGEDVWRFAWKVPGANIPALEDRVLVIGRALDLTNFAKTIPGANVHRILQKLLALDAGSALVLFAQGVERLDAQAFEAIQARLLEIGGANDLYAFACTVAQADVRALRDRYLQLTDSPYWAAKFEALVQAGPLQSAPAPAFAPAPVAARPTVLAADLPGQFKAPKGRAIAQDVLDVLMACRVEGHRVYLPAAQLERDLYQRVNDVLVAFGGDWKSGKIKAHVFQEDPAPLLAVAIDTGEFLKPSDVGFFPTPQREVDRVMALAKIEPGMSTLEPSAGRGAFALAMLKAVGNNPDLVTVCDLLPSNVRALQEAGFTKVVQGDFLTLEPQPIFDRIVMNPPFNGGVDIDHVMHATRFLNPTGRLTAITSVGWESGSSRKAEDFRDFVQDVDAFIDEIERGAFKASGTNVPTKILSIEAENLPWYRDSDQEPPPQPF